MKRVVIEYLIGSLIGGFVILVSPDFWVDHITAITLLSTIPVAIWSWSESQFALGLQSHGNTEGRKLFVDLMLDDLLTYRRYEMWVLLIVTCALYFWSFLFSEIIPFVALSCILTVYSAIRHWWYLSSTYIVHYDSASDLLDIDDEDK